MLDDLLQDIASPVLMEAYTKATQEAYGYLRVDLHPSSDSPFLLTSAFLSDFPIVYLPDDKESDDRTFTLLEVMDVTARRNIGLLLCLSEFGPQLRNIILQHLND